MSTKIESSTTPPSRPTTSTSSVPPSLPPLYFAENDNLQAIHKRNVDSFIIEPFPSETLSTITSYLDWGDYARLSVTNTSFRTIVHDAARNDVQKWNLALALLNGTNGLECNPTLAMKYLVELASVDVEKDDFDPSFEPMMQKYVQRESNDEEKEGPSTIGEEDNIYTTLAMKKIAKCYFEGNGIAKDSKLGLAWLKKAHHFGDVESAYETALIYEYSKYDVEVDIYHAAEWFLGAAKAGHVESMAEYAMCLELGCGVDQSDDQALDWYTKAAEKGHITSNFSVGEMFEQARGGLPQSDTEAVLWYYKAALMGDEDSKKALVRLGDIARIVIPGWANTLNV